VFLLRIFKQQKVHLKLSLLVGQMREVDLYVSEIIYHLVNYTKEGSTVEAIIKTLANNWCTDV
jgi:hypothetical protein